MMCETSSWNWAYIDSIMTCGTWSFDVNYMGTDGFNVWLMSNELVASDYYNPREGYFIQISMYTSSIQLMRDLNRQQIVLGKFTPLGGLDGWWSISVTRSSNGEFEVYVNNVLVIQAQDTTFDDSSWFAFETYNTHSIDNILFVESSVEVDSEALPDVLTVVATDSLYVVPGDYLQCQLSWLNIDPGTAENVQVYLIFSEYLEFVSSSIPVTIDGDSFVFEIGSIQGFSIEDIEITFFMANLLAPSGTEFWMNATLSYTDTWAIYTFEAKDSQMVTVVTEIPENDVHKSSWWKKEFSYVLNGKSATYDRAYLESLVTMISYSSELFTDVTSLESALSILLVDTISGHLGKAMGEVYGVWLNLANDALTADTEIDLTDLTTAGTVGEALIECEAILLDPSSSDDDLKNVEKICSEINAEKY
ncbi:hypothetical protein EU528_06980 [Candidatus Thorarchaeota archaeon]|nr:MAG: hypothetical protein EU528_06980 [Candidatus Thorarchaeota archaeon]